MGLTNKHLSSKENYLTAKRLMICWKKSQLKIYDFIERVFIKSDSTEQSTTLKSLKQQRSKTLDVMKIYAR